SVGGFAMGSWQCLERIFKRGTGTEVDTGKPFPDCFRIDPASAVAGYSAGEHLGLERRAARGVERHPLEHLDPFLRSVIGSHDALQSVAAVATQQESFLLLRAWNA